MFQLFNDSLMEIYVIDVFWRGTTLCHKLYTSDQLNNRVGILKRVYTLGQLQGFLKKKHTSRIEKQRFHDEWIRKLKCPDNFTSMSEYATPFVNDRRLLTTRKSTCCNKIFSNKLYCRISRIFWQPKYWSRLVRLKIFSAISVAMIDQNAETGS